MPDAETGPVAPAPEDQTRDLGKKTFHSILWTVARNGSANGFSFIVFSALARLLTPAEFGTYALALVVVEVTKVISVAGLGDTVQRIFDLDEELADTAFWANLAFGSLIGALLWLAADPYATLIGQPGVAPILHWLSLMVPVTSLGGIHTARTLRDFGHRKITTRIMAGGLLGGVCAVIAAWDGWGVWSLVLQAGIVDVTGLFFAWRFFPWVPRLRFSWARLRAVLPFSSSLLLTQLLHMMLSRVQDLLIGSFLGVAALGAYRVAWRMVEIIAQATFMPVATVALVTLSRLQNDRAAFGRAFLRILALSAIVTFPAIAGFGALAEDLIPAVFGAKWAGSVGVAHVLAFLAVPYMLAYLAPQALAAMGRSAAMARLAALQLSVTVAFTFLAMPYGVVAVAAAFVLRACVNTPYLLRLLRLHTGVGAMSVLRVIWPPLLATLLMVGVVVLARAAFEQVGLGAGSRLAACVPVGMLAYTLALLVVGRDFLAGHADSFKRRMPGVLKRYLYRHAAVAEGVPAPGRP